MKKLSHGEGIDLLIGMLLSVGYCNWHAKESRSDTVRVRYTTSLCGNRAL
ncbi:MAG: hypothetical protein OS130_13065 [Thermodesulfobacteriota bacterium]|nr:MAG: hypothetical protein OS130_13065 [Thermodesulfobacteriota bacterium]